MNIHPDIEIYYFSSEDCGVCKVLKPKIMEMIVEKFPQVSIRQIDIKAEPAVAAQYTVFTLPVLLILAEGKEHTRFIRSFSVNEVEAKLARISSLINS